MKKIALILALCCACGPAWQLKRAKKLKIEAEANGAKIKADTVYKVIHLKGPQTSIPILVNKQGGIYVFHHDSIIYRDKIKFTIKKIHDSILVEAKCPDTDLKTPAVVNETISAGVADWWRPVAITALALLICSIAMLVYKLKI